jgi:hypothetical protein
MGPAARVRMVQLLMLALAQGQNRTTGYLDDALLTFFRRGIHGEASRNQDPASQLYRRVMAVIEEHPRTEAATLGDWVC